MSRAILPSTDRWDRSTGIKCPPIILRNLLAAYPQGLIPYDLPRLGDRANVAISEVTNKHIIFKIACDNVKIRQKEVGGQYAYGDDWEAVLIQRQRLFHNLEVQDLYDLVVTNTAHWGEAAEIALDFLSQTLE